MTIILGIIIIVIFLAISGMHFYWAFGGRNGFDKSLPTTLDGKKIFTPRKIDCIIVGIGLLGFSAFYLHHLNIIQIPISNTIQFYISWIIPAIFLFRAIGEFKYVGFFKRITQTEFAKVDSKYYSPLCIIIAFCGIALNVILS